MNYKKESIELEYYIKEGISPVHYKLKNINKHFEIRKSLYRLLGLIPSFMFKKDILEVAPGSGHNSIYTASLLPKNYDLVEPNPNGCRDIKNLFKQIKIKHTKPNLHELPLDDYSKKKLYDLVITEGWPGGHLKYDRKMLKKLSGFVKPGGLLFITYYPPIGGVSTYLRRLIGNRLISKKDNLKIKTDILKKSFSSHLLKMKSMTRSHEHWIQDSLLNPYIVVGYNTPLISTKIFGNKFEIYSSVPKFTNDWRWYKSLHGQNKKFNKAFFKDYFSISHNMIDYKIEGLKRSELKNKKLEKLCINLSILTKDYESGGVEIYKKKIRPIVKKIINNLKGDIPLRTVRGLEEADKILLKKKITTEDVKFMKYFSNLFGREQSYLSFSKND